ncbi:MAG: hypothetical protein AAFQ27_15460 [Pseudomonadota bacterium]
MRFILPLAALFTLTSCQPPPIEIKLRHNENGTQVRLSQDNGILFSKIEPPCIDFIQLMPGHTTGGGNLDGVKPVWSVYFERVDGQSCVDLGTFRVGNVPAGFTEEVPFAGMPPGDYSLWVSGLGDGWREFTIE